MARVDVPITQVTDTGVAPPAQVVADPVNNHSLAWNDGSVFIEATNTDASVVRNVTVETPGSVSGLAVADRVIAVPAAGGVRLIGPLPPAVYNQADGTVYVDVDNANLRLRAYAV